MARINHKELSIGVKGSADRRSVKHIEHVLTSYTRILESQNIKHTKTFVVKLSAHKVTIESDSKEVVMDIRISLENAQFSWKYILCQQNYIYGRGQNQERII